MSPPEIHFDTLEDEPVDRGAHRPACRATVHQVLFDQPRGISGEQSIEWECVPGCPVGGEEEA